MNDFSEIVNFSYEKKPEKEVIDRLVEKLLTDNNIVDINIDDRSICIEYYQQLTSEKKLHNLIENMGVELKPSREILGIQYEKNPYKRFLKRMAASNDKRFGSKRLDCCDLHNETN